jgi:hypothetical protein
MVEEYWKRMHMPRRENTNKTARRHRVLLSYSGSGRKPLLLASTTGHNQLTLTPEPS